MVYFERVAQLCYHAILEVRGGITHPHTRHPHSLAPIEQVLSRNLGCASLGCLQGNEIDTVASARRSGQEDFQRGTPPVSLASRSISVELVLSRSDPQKTTRQTARGHQSWSPCYCSTSTCDYMETLRLGTFFWLHRVPQREQQKQQQRAVRHQWASHWLVCIGTSMVRFVHVRHHREFKRTTSRMGTLYQCPTRLRKGRD